MTRGRALTAAVALAGALVAGTWPGAGEAASPSLFTVSVTAGNVALLAFALWLALPRIGGAAVLLLFAGPIVWWIDKPQTTAAAFALMAATSDLHGGATPGLSRYGMWLAPLAIPFWRGTAAIGGRAWHRFAWSVAFLSAVGTVFAFHPAVRSYGRAPGWAASVLWTRHPVWNNPLPEISAESLHGGGDRAVPVATADCEKILIMGTADGAMFPVPCFPAVVPVDCATERALCYANRAGDKYVFARAPGSAHRHSGFAHQPRLVWPAGSAPHVRQLLTQAEWWQLAPKRRSSW